MSKIAISLAVLTVVSVGCTQQDFPAPISDIRNKIRSTMRQDYVVVGEKDTLFSISKRVNMDYQQLAAINKISSPYTIYKGQRIKTKPAPSEQVKKYAYIKESAVRPNQAVKKEVAKPEVKTVALKPLGQSPSKDTIKSEELSTKRRVETTSNLQDSWRWPVKGSVSKVFSKNNSKFFGVDITNSEGTPITAAKSGKVVYSGDALRGYGNLIIIKHEENFLSAYAHNRKNIVKEGERVICGQKIAEMGSSGTDKVKLHFQVRQGGKPINPLNVLPR